MNPRLLLSIIVMVFLLITACAAWGRPAAPIQWLGSIEIAVGRGEKGPWQQNASRYDYVDDPTVAIDVAGAIAIAWADQQKKDVLFQRVSADGVRQGSPINVSNNSASFSWLPRIIIAPQDAQRIYILWQEIIFSGGSHGGDILFARSDDAGASFSAPLNLSNSVGGDGKGRINRDVWSNGSLDLAISSNGHLYAAWTEYEGGLWLARSTNGGKDFSSAHRVAGDQARPARAPALAIGPDHAVYLAWTVGQDPGADIRVARSRDHGNSFGPPQMVGAGRGYSDAPKLAFDARGTLHLVYAESAGGPFARYHIRHSRWLEGGGGFGAARAISSSSVVSAGVATSAGYPALAADAQGRVCVIWEVFADPEASPFSLAFTVSDDGGDSFTPPAMVPASRDPAAGRNGSQQGLLMKKLAMNAAGAIAIVNSSLQPNQRSRVWLMRAQWLR